MNTSTFTGNFGEIAQQEIGDSSGYELYVMGFESALDKRAYQSGYWKAENKAKFITDFLTSECEKEMS